jgi:hypothetical protein
MDSEFYCASKEVVKYPMDIKSSPNLKSCSQGTSLPSIIPFRDPTSVSNAKIPAREVACKWLNLDFRLY